MSGIVVGKDVDTDAHIVLTEKGVRISRSLKIMLREQLHLDLKKAIGYTPARPMPEPQDKAPMPAIPIHMPIRKASASGRPQSLAFGGSPQQTLMDKHLNREPAQPKQQLKDTVRDATKRAVPGAEF